MKFVYILTATIILLSISTLAFAAAGHDKLREQSAFSKSISGQILGKYAVRKQENDRANAMRKMTPQARRNVAGRTTTYQKGDKVYSWSPRTDD